MFGRLRNLTAGAAIAVAAMMPAHATTVDLELSLLIDVSGSVNSTEFNLQRQGYVDAFKDASVWAAIAQGAIGKIAANFIYWSGSSQQSESVGWTLIDSAQAAIDFADAILGTTRPFSGLTAPGSAIDFASPLFDNNGFDGTRNVIDVSGDGSQNAGASTSAARDAFCGKGSNYAINGIAILGSEFGLDTWYANNIQCGTGSFTVAASSFASFGDAIKDKLVREIGPPPPPPVPLPAAGWLMIAGLGALAAARRRKA